MALIEGVGDEVTILVGILVILVVLTLAWISTGVADRPFVSVIVLDRQTFQVNQVEVSHSEFFLKTWLRYLKVWT